MKALLGQYLSYGIVAVSITVGVSVVYYYSDYLKKTFLGDQSAGKTEQVQTEDPLKPEDSPIASQGDGLGDSDPDSDDPNQDGLQGADSGPAVASTPGDGNQAIQPKAAPSDSQPKALGNSQPKAVPKKSQPTAKTNQPAAMTKAQPAPAPPPVQKPAPAPKKAPPSVVKKQPATAPPKAQPKPPPKAAPKPAVKKQPPADPKPPAQKAPKKVAPPPKPKKAQPPKDALEPIQPQPKQAPLPVEPELNKPYQPPKLTKKATELEEGEHPSEQVIEEADKAFKKGHFWAAAHRLKALGWDGEAAYAASLAGKNPKGIKTQKVFGPFPDSVKKRRGFYGPWVPAFDACLKGDPTKLQQSCFPTWDEHKLSYLEFRAIFELNQLKKDQFRMMRLCRYADRYSDPILLKKCADNMAYSDDYAGAVAVQQKLVQVEPNKQNSEDYGYLLIRAKEYDEAVDYLEDSIDKYGGSFFSFNSLGQAHFFNKDYDDAAEAFIKASEKNPLNEEVLNNIGLCFLFQDELEDAEKYFRKAYDLNPQYILVIKRLLKIYKKQGDAKNYKEMKKALAEAAAMGG